MGGRGSKVSKQQTLRKLAVPASKVSAQLARQLLESPAPCIDEVVLAEQPMQDATLHKDDEKVAASPSTEVEDAQVKVARNQVCHEEKAEAALCKGST